MVKKNAGGGFVTRKRKTIIIVVVVLVVVLLITGGVIYACWHTWINQGPLPIVAGVFEGEMKDNKGEILSCARLEITEINEEEFLFANGVNVIKDASRRRTADYYRFELYIGGDKDNLEQVEIVGLHYREYGDPNFNYYLIDNFDITFQVLGKKTKMYAAQGSTVYCYKLIYSKELEFSGTLRG